MKRDIPAGRAPVLDYRTIVFDLNEFDRTSRLVTDPLAHRVMERRAEMALDLWMNDFNRRQGIR
jgi:hypothetical protein